jgi:hypothetical protein
VNNKAGRRTKSQRKANPVTWLMKITRISCTDDGISAFEEVESELTNSGTIGSLSKPFPVSSVVFREVPPEYDFDWHPAPHRQYTSSSMARLRSNQERVINADSVAAIFFCLKTPGVEAIARARLVANFVDLSSTSTPESWLFEMISPETTLGSVAWSDLQILVQK